MLEVECLGPEQLLETGQFVGNVHGGGRVQGGRRGGLGVHDLVDEELLLLVRRQQTHLVGGVGRAEGVEGLGGAGQRQVDSA